MENRIEISRNGRAIDAELGENCSALQPDILHVNMETILPIWLGTPADVQPRWTIVPVSEKSSIN